MRVQSDARDPFCDEPRVLPCCHGLTNVAVGDLDMPPAFQRREHHEQIGDAIAFVFVIVTRWPD
jgi:hypothetical protein